MPSSSRSLFRRSAVVAAVVVAITGAGTVAAEACWTPPVAASVADPFREPACRWCPGNRGIEYETRPGQSVRAVDSGRVTFSGRVAGVRYLVIEHRDGRRVTYGRLATSRYGRGDLVLRGRAVGTTGASFHFGLRIGDRYVDPAPYLGRLVGRPRLVPLDGAGAAPAPPPRLTCRRRARVPSGRPGGVFRRPPR